MADAVVFGNLLITLLGTPTGSRSASLAQLVNVIAPIMTEPGGPAWRQTTFFPFAITSRLARGEVLGSQLDAPTYDDERLRRGRRWWTRSRRTTPRPGARAVFLVNRSQDRAAEYRRHRRPSAT